MMGLGRMMTGSTGARERHPHDFYPTPPEATRALLETESPYLEQYQEARAGIQEPACGDGRLGRVLEAKGFRVFASDLYDRGYGRAGVDFLQARGPSAPALITNPPFSIADKFIRQAYKLGYDYGAFLLKATYWHAASRHELFYHWPPAVVYAMTWRLDFTGDGSSPMDCVWVVWRGGTKYGDTRYRPMAHPDKQPGFTWPGLWGEG